MPELVCADDLVVRACLQATSEHRCAANSSALWCFLVWTRVHDGGDTGMADDSAVVERGVLTSDAARWELAVQRAGVTAEGVRAGKALAGRGGLDVGSAAGQIEWRPGR